MADRNRKSPETEEQRDGWNRPRYFANRRRQFLALSMPVRVILILLPLMALYTAALYIKDLCQPALRTNLRPTIGPPQLWLFGTTTPYHITTDISNFCSYRSFDPLVQSSLSPLALPNEHSSHSKDSRGSAASSLTSDKVSEPPSSPDDNGNDSGAVGTGQTHDDAVYPFTLHHHGNLVLGYGIVRLRIFSSSYDWETPDRYRTEPASYNTVLTNVLHVPTAPDQVISVSKLLSDDAHGYIEHSRTDANETVLKHWGHPDFYAWSRGGVYMLEAKSWVSDQGDCNNTFTARPKFAV